MLELKNKSPFATIISPNLNKYGHSSAIVIIKGTFDIHPNTTKLSIADEQIPIVQSDVFYGELGKSSIKYEADVAPTKPALDIILNGFAYAPAGYPVTMLDASLQVGGYKQMLRIIGNRYWLKSSITWQQSAPLKFDRMPIIYENAYGGSVQLSSDPIDTEFCFYNPVGKGFVGSKGKGLKEGIALPNIENPLQLIRYYDDDPMPVGTGAIARNWQPRIAFAGTYDEQWQQERKPLLPLDFDDRYHNAAHPLFTLPKLVADGEQVVAVNFSESGQLKFDLPSYHLVTTTDIQGRKIIHDAVMDTVTIEPESNKVLITWRTAIPCANRFLYIEKITVDWSLA